MKAITARSRFSALDHVLDRTMREERSVWADDVLPTLIEVFFRTVAKVSLAQYLQAGAPSPALNQYLCWALRPAGKVTVGMWVKIIRGVVHSLRNDLSNAHKRGLPLQGLLSCDMGLESDLAHPVSRLVAFRSSFSHGAMVSPPEKELAEYRGYLDTLAQSLCFLRAEMTEDPRGCPVLLTADGQLPLYPLFTFDGGCAVERPLSMPDDQRLGEMVRRYETELVGDFTEHMAVLRNAFPHPPGYTVVPDVMQSLLRAMSDGGRIVQLIGRPQTGKSALVANIDAYVPGAVGLRIEPGMLTQSTIAVSRFLLRHLGGPASAKEAAEDKLATAVAQAAAKEGAPVTVAFDDAHVGLGAHPSSLTCIAQAVRMWVPPEGRHSRLTLILVSTKGWHVGLPGMVIHELDDRASYLARRKGFARDIVREVGQRSAMARQIMGMLKNAVAPLTLFEIADRLERRIRSRVFTPEVEHCLQSSLSDILECRDKKYSLWTLLNVSTEDGRLGVDKEVARG